MLPAYDYLLVLAAFPHVPVVGVAGSPDMGAFCAGILIAVGVVLLAHVQVVLAGRSHGCSPLGQPGGVSYD